MPPLPARCFSTPEEAEQWLAEHMYPEAGIEPDTVDIAKLRKALELLEYPVGGNAAFLLHEGRSDDEVMQYLIKYSMLPMKRCSSIWNS